MKKKVTAVIIFLSILVFPMVSWPIMAQFDTTVLNENRSKAAAPSFGDRFFAEFDAYFADRAPYRNPLIKLYNNLWRELNLSYEKLLLSWKIPYYTIINQALLGLDDWLFFTGDNSLSYYKGTNIPTEQELQEFVARAEKVNDYCQAQGKEFIIYIAPNKEQIYSEYMPRSIAVVNEIKRADVIYNYFKEHSNVTVVYPKNELLNAKSSNFLYYQQDSHWNALGGYIGAKSVFQAFNLPLGDVEMTKISHKGGDLANMALVDLIDDGDFKVDYRPEIALNCNRSYYEAEYSSTNANGRRLLFLGDSFRENMQNVLAKEFEHSVINHRNTFTSDNNYLREEFDAATHVVFQVVERYDVGIFSLGGFLQSFINVYGL